MSPSQHHRPPSQFELPPQRVGGADPFIPALSVYKHRADPALVAVVLGSHELLSQAIRLPRRKD